MTTTIDPANSPIARTDRGDALQLAWGLMDIGWGDGFDQAAFQSAFTVEIIAMPRVVREWLVTGVFPETCSRPESGWALMIGHQGELAAMIVTRAGKTRIVWNHSRILDGEWHHLAMTYDGQSLNLYVDGKLSPQEELLTDAVDLGHPPGLRIGAHTGIVCEGQVRELHVSRGVRSIEPVAEQLQSDPHTIGLWRIDARLHDDHVPDISGRSSAGAIKTFSPESLDEADSRSYNAGPSPLDVPTRRVELQHGQIEHASPPNVMSLDGEWQMTDDDANWQTAIPAIVPGSVHTALRTAGRIPDPTFGLNESIAREQSFKTWWFRKTFARPSGEGHRLIFDGVAIHCTVWLNGEKLGEHEGMFGGPSFDVSHLIRDTNELIVKIDPAPTGPPWFAPTANTGWKKTVVFNNVYGWHYCHIPSLGIWRSVRVESSPAVKLLNPFVVTHDAHEGEISIRIDLQGRCEGRIVGTIAPENFEGETHHFAFSPSPGTPGEGRGEGTALTCEVRNFPNGPHPHPLPGYRERGPEAQLHFRLSIPNPKIWWPNWHGEPNLYRLTLSFHPHDGGQSDCITTTFALRTIKMAPLPAGPRPTLYNWTFVVNGRPMFMNGTGWCTMDPLMDFSPARYERFLQLAKDQNCQMLRCWGSGMPETNEFYDQCDRLGLLVMQEWPTAWNSHQDQPIDALEETVRLNTLRLRNHPSLAIYGGGNEPTQPFGEAIDMMGRLAIELDGTRPFHRGEPWGGSDHNYGCWWGNLPLDHNLKLVGRFFGEFGIASMPVYESVQRYLPDDEKHLWPPREDGAFAHHTPVFNTMQDMDRLRQYAGYFSACGSTRRFIDASQIAQAVAVRHTLERGRTCWPHCTGAMMYKLNDNYPAASWSTVDWYGAAKISHWFVQDAFAPLHACVIFESSNIRGQSIALPVFLLDDADALAGVPWRVCVRAYNGQLRLIQAEEFTGSGSIRNVLHVGDFALTDRQTDTTPLLLVAEVHRNGELFDRTFYFVNYEDRKDCLFDLPTTTVSLRVEDNEAILQNTGTLPAVGVSVQRMGHLNTFTASDNCIWLEAGETKRIHISDPDGLTVDGWNIKLN